MSVFQLRVFVLLSLHLKSEILLNNFCSSVKTDFFFCLFSFNSPNKCF